jgi:hypothetical protein
LLTQTGQLFIYAQEEGNIQLSHKHGFYYEPFTLFVASQDQNAKLHYTLDGTHPFYSSTSVKGNSNISIRIDPKNFSNRDYSPGVVLRICAVAGDDLIGRTVTQTFLFPNRYLDLSLNNVKPGQNWLTPNGTYDINYGLDPEIYNDPKYENFMMDALLSIPTISLVTDLKSLFSPDSGIYVNALEHGIEWERYASLELLNPDGSEGFQIDCGLRIRGGWSRHYDNPKHAFRLIFREKYGEGKLKYPLFGNEGVDEFDNIDLRTSQNYSWAYQGDSRNTFIREVFSRDTQRDIGQPYTRSRYYHLFINGTYWGLYQSQERSEASFAESYFGGNKEDYDVIKVDVENYLVIEATDGTLDKWRSLWDYGQIGFQSDELYFKVQGMNIDGSKNSSYEKLLDVDNLIDYMIITFFTGDFDGPISNFQNNEKPNNFYAIYNRVNPDGFKFFRHDGEHTLFNNVWGIDRTGPFPAGQNFQHSNPQWIHQKLSENKKYRLRFADRVQKYFYNDGALTYGNNVKRLIARKNEIEYAIIAESARWGDSKTSNPFTKEDWTNEINYILNNYLPPRNDTVLMQLINKGLYSIDSAPKFNIHGGIVEKGFQATLFSSFDSIYYTTNGSDPYLPANADENDFSIQLINQSSSKKVLIPNSYLNDEWINNLDYNDDSWIETEGGIGYDLNGGYNQHISFNTMQYMHESAVSPNNSCLIRIPFSVSTEQLSEGNQLYLDMLYDDGFALYLNGSKIISVNAPENLEWNSSSETYLDSEGYERFYLSDYLNLINNGENLLSIHAVNISIQSSDFLISPILTIAKQTNSGIVSPDAKLYQSPIIINETTTIKARTLNNNNWGVLSEAKFIIDENLSNLKVTELHYHPLDEIVGQDTISGKEYEFIEIKNIGSTDLNLSGSSFIDGIAYTFPQGSIIFAGEFLVLSSNSEMFLNRYGFSSFDQYSGSLDNSGERIAFINAASEEVIAFVYNDKLPWPEEADGDGYSLVSERTNPIGNPNDVNYWTLSGKINGSPLQNDIVSDALKEENIAPTEYSLSQNYPNPFNPNTTIKYSLSKQSHVTLSIYDILGRRVKLLVNEIQQAGNYRINFNAQRLASGIYYYRIQSNDFVQTKKMVILK